MLNGLGAFHVGMCSSKSVDIDVVAGVAGKFGVTCCLILVTFDPGDGRGAPKFIVERCNQRQVINVIELATWFGTAKCH